jgi:hypothetical protein
MRSDKEPYRAGTVSFPDRVKTTGCETRSTSRLEKTRHGTVKVVESVKVTKR